MNDLSNRNKTHSDLPLFSSELFGGALAPGLPDQESAEEPPSSENPRQPIIERVFAKAEPMLIERYKECLFAVGRERENFGAWHITQRFESAFRKLDKREVKTLGGLFMQLQNHGVLIADGVGKRPNGNLGPVYRLKK